MGNGSGGGAGVDEYTGPLRPMFKSEIAELAGYRTGYFWRLVHGDEELMSRLAQAGYKRTQKMLTVRQVRLVLGEFGFIG